MSEESTPYGPYWKFRARMAEIQVGELHDLVAGNLADAERLEAQVRELREALRTARALHGHGPTGHAPHPNTCPLCRVLSTPEAELEVQHPREDVA